MSRIVEDADAFLGIADQFRLGELPTEQCHPLTDNLSSLALNDLAAAYTVLQQVDAAALKHLSLYAENIQTLAQDINTTFADGKRIFMAGCGATGRLSLALETLCREGLLGAKYRESVIGFMAGGDSALIRSLEGFEDFPQYGARQLAELGFESGDLMIGITEGGETPFVIGATEAACLPGARKPWFCYCNPNEVLCQVAERSAQVLQNDGIRKLPLVVGAMALSGSTRMQASTVQMAAIGLALKYHDAPEAIPAILQEFIDCQSALDYASLAPLTKREAEHYQDGGHVLYTTREYGLTVLTDTTERAPTFSLVPFENQLFLNPPLSLCYLSLPDYPDTDAAWLGLLGRVPRTVEWPEVRDAAGYATMRGYDISAKAASWREDHWGREALRFTIEGRRSVCLCLGRQETSIAMPECALLRNLLLKMLLNAHSTLVMGQLGRYEGNLMTWVKPSNNKLIDRAIRYVCELYRRKHAHTPDYARTCHALFCAREQLQHDEAIVLKTLAVLESEG